MLTITVGLNWTNIWGEIPSEVKKELKELLQFEVPNHQFMPNFILNKWDGIKRFYVEKTDKLFLIHSGHLNLVLSFLDQYEIDYKIDNPFLPMFKDEIDYSKMNLKGITLKDNQIYALKEIIKNGRGILQAPTGSGKTEISLALIKYYLDDLYSRNEGTIVLILTHRQTVFDMVWKKRIKKRLDVIENKSDIPGILNFNYKNSWITLAMAQTFVLNIDKFASSIRIKLIICDEIHNAEPYMRNVPDEMSKELSNLSRHLKSKTKKFKTLLKKKTYDEIFVERLQESMDTMESLAEAFSETPKNSFNVKIFKKLKAPYKIGLSATPVDIVDGQQDLIQKMNLTSHFGDILEIEHEYDHEVKIKMFEVDYDFVAADYRDAKRLLFENPQRLEIIKKVLDPTDQTIIFVKEIAHGTRLMRELRINFIHGKTPRKIRDDLCKQFEDGKLKNLIVNGIFWFGIDINCINHIILVHIEKSFKNVVQAIGRGRREDEGKDILKVTDFYDLEDIYLEEHSCNRLDFYKFMKYDVEIIELEE